MPNHFQLISKETGLPVSVSIIDTEMCQHFNVEASDLYYHRDWYQCVGPCLATGKGWAFIHGIVDGIADGGGCTEENASHFHEIINWLDEHYQPEARRIVMKLFADYDGQRTIFLGEYQSIEEMDHVADTIEAHGGLEGWNYVFTAECSIEEKDSIINAGSMKGWDCILMGN